LKLEQELRKVEEIEYKSKLDPFTEYVDVFIQRQPRYAVKQIGKSTWRTKKKPLSDRPIKAHLNGQYYVAVLGKWYPGSTVLDVDDRDRDEAEKIRESLKLDTNNSMIISSESPNSYHVLLRPSYNGKPLTIRLLNDILKPYAREHNIEIYPQPNKPIRLPFGNGQKPLDFEYTNLYSWQEMLYWFNKLDYFDLKGILNHQLRLDFEIGPDKENSNKSEYQEGKFLWENGLLGPSSRHDSQFKILCYLHRQNTPLTVAIEECWQWIKKKHNGYSKTIADNPRVVKQEIIRQAKSVYGKREFYNYYPDETHNNHKGYLTKADIEEIIMLSRASLPKAKFLFNLIKYCYPRRHQKFIQIHSDSLLEWSQRGYIKHLEALQRQEIIKRYDSYSVDKRFAKSIKINWNFKEESKAILVDRRAPEEFRQSVTACYEPEEFRELLIKAGSERTNAIKAVKSIYRV